MVLRKFPISGELDIDISFPNERACVEYLRQRRWPNLVKCPRCSSQKIYELSARPNHWQCHGCSKKGYRFSVRVGTVFEDSRLPLRLWFQVLQYVLDIRNNNVVAMSFPRLQRMARFNLLEFHRESWPTASYKSVCRVFKKLTQSLKDLEFLHLMNILKESYGSSELLVWSSTPPPLSFNDFFDVPRY
jgi:transposase-like protein